MQPMIAVAGNRRFNPRWYLASANPEEAGCAAQITKHKVPAWIGPVLPDLTLPRAAREFNPDLSFGSGAPPVRVPPWLNPQLSFGPGGSRFVPASSIAVDPPPIQANPIVHEGECLPGERGAGGCMDMEKNGKIVCYCPPWSAPPTPAGRGAPGRLRTKRSRRIQGSQGIDPWDPPPGYGSRPWSAPPTPAGRGAPGRLTAKRTRRAKVTRGGRRVRRGGVSRGRSGCYKTPADSCKPGYSTSGFDHDNQRICCPGKYGPVIRNPLNLRGALRAMRASPVSRRGRSRMSMCVDACGKGAGSHACIQRCINQSITAPPGFDFEAHCAKCTNLSGQAYAACVKKCIQEWITAPPGVDFEEHCAHCTGLAWPAYGECIFDCLSEMWTAPRPPDYAKECVDYCGKGAGSQACIQRCLTETLTSPPGYGHGGFTRPSVTRRRLRNPPPTPTPYQQCIAKYCWDVGGKKKTAKCISEYCAWLKHVDVPGAGRPGRFRLTARRPSRATMRMRRSAQRRGVSVGHVLVEHHHHVHGHEGPFPHEPDWKKAGACCKSCHEGKSCEGGCGDACNCGKEGKSAEQNPRRARGRLRAVRPTRPRGPTSKDVCKAKCKLHPDPATCFDECMGGQTITARPAYGHGRWGRRIRR